MLSLKCPKHKTKFHPIPNLWGYIWWRVTESTILQSLETYLLTNFVWIFTPNHLHFWTTQSTDHSPCYGLKLWYHCFSHVGWQYRQYVGLWDAHSADLHSATVYWVAPLCSAFYVPVTLNYLSFLPHAPLASLHPFDCTNPSGPDCHPRPITSLHLYTYLCANLAHSSRHSSNASSFRNFLISFSRRWFHPISCPIGPYLYPAT